MKVLKSYKVFTSFSYRLVMFVVLPLMVLLIGLLGNIRGGEEFLFIIPLVCIVEIVADHWVFGGIQSKNMAKMDYLKCSKYGMQLIKNGLWMDQLRRLIETILIIMLYYFVQYKIINQNDSAYQLNLSGYIVVAIMIYALTSLGTFLSRYGEMIWVNMIVCNIFSILASILYWVFVDKIVFAAIIWTAAAVIVAVLSVRTAEKKVRNSYYDK